MSITGIGIVIELGGMLAGEPGFHFDAVRDHALRADHGFGRGAYATSAFLSAIETARKGIAGGLASCVAGVLGVLVSAASLLLR